MKRFVDNVRTGEIYTANEKNMRLLKRCLLDTLKCKKLNKRSWIYDMVDWLKIPILRYHNTAKAKFRWEGGGSTENLLYHINDFTIKHAILWQKYANTYFKHNVESRRWINTLLIATSMDALNIRVNEKFELLPILDQGGIVCLKLMI